MMRRLLLLLVFALMAANSAAQNAWSGSTSPNAVPEFSAFLNNLRSTEQTAKGSSVSYSPAQNLEDLVRKVQPSQYLSGGVVNTYGEKPRNLFVDVTSLSGLNNPMLLKNNIDIVTIRINNASQLSASIDLSQFASFKSLKYVHIVSNVNATPAQFTNMVTNPDDRLTVFYSINTGEGNQ